MPPKSSPPSTFAHFFPPKATFTDKDIPADLSGKVYLITGANSGMGAELTKVMYSKDATVYLACRSKEQAETTIANIKSQLPQSKGKLISLHLDQADLHSVKTAAQTFLAQESRLDVLFNNAGVMPGNPIERTDQGHELALGVNCLAPFLLTKLLHPVLKATALSRVVWLSSYALVGYAPKEKGVDMSAIDHKLPKAGIDRYGISKAGDWLLAVSFAQKWKADGITSVAINPGNIKTNLPQHQGLAVRLVANLVCYPAINGVYTQLFAGFAPEVERMDSCEEWVVPWGRIARLRVDLPVAVKAKEEGGNGNAEEFSRWCEERVEEYL